jgi:hypothetical protein
MQAWIKVSNRSDHPCFLREMPVVELLGAEGSVLSIEPEPCHVRVSSTSGSACDPHMAVVLVPGLGPPEAERLKPGHARMLLYWSTHDGAGRCTASVWPIESVLAVRFRLESSGDEVVVEMPDAHLQDGPNALGKAACGRGRVTYWPFQDEWYRRAL